jgi:hypothetical protein
VVIALAAVGVLAMTFSTVTVRDVAAVERATHAQRLAFVAHASLARAVHQWRDDSLWSRDLGATISHTTALANGERVVVDLHRTHPLAFTARAVASYRDRRQPVAARRELQQVIWLAPPTVRTHAAMTVLGDVSGLDPTLVTGTDLADVQSPCGPGRDTLSIAALAAPAVSAEGTGAWTLMPTTTALPIDSSDTFHGVRSAALSMGTVILRSSDPAPLPVTVSTSPRWQLLSLQGPVGHITGNNHYRGLLLMDGDLTLTGTLRVEGMLIVRGALDARHGQLTVNGGVIVLGVGVAPGSTAARMGSATRVQFDRCRLEMALATIAVPRAAPFRVWQLGVP